MCKIIAISNQKGGSGKTTTASSLGFGLAKFGKKVLLIDFDPQGSLSIALGIMEQDLLEYSIYNVFDLMLKGKADEIDYTKGIYKHDEGVDLMPCNIYMSDIENRLIAKEARNTYLSRYINEVKENYDYILIDCSPSLNVLTINALSAADSVLIPVKPDLLNTKGLEQLINTIMCVKKEWLYNPRLMLEGIVLTQVDTRRTNDKEFMNFINKAYGSMIKIFDTYIPLTVKGSEVANSGMSIFKYDPKSKLAESYEKLALEVLANE